MANELECVDRWLDFVTANRRLGLGIEMLGPDPLFKWKFNRTLLTKDCFNKSLLAQEIERRWERKRLVMKTVRKTGKDEVKERCKPSPSPPWKEEPVHPLEIVPAEEVWKYLLNMLSEPKDVNSAYYACTQFRDILEQKRKLVQLPGVLKIMEARSYLDMKSILSLRCCSKSFRDAVDKTFFKAELETDKTLWASQIIGHNEESNDTLGHVTEVNELIDILSTSLVDGDKKTAIMPTRVLSISDARVSERDNDLEALEQFHLAVSQLILLCGKSLWRFNYYSVLPYWKLYILVKEYAQLMPNLKFLEVNSFKHEQAVDSDSNEHDEAVYEELERLKETIEAHPFPKLPYLSFLSTGAPEEISMEIIRKNMHVRNVKYDLPISDRSCRVLERVNLESLIVERLFPHTLGWLEYYGVNGKWPLKRISVWDGSIDHVWKASVLFKFLDYFRDTLEIVMVAIEGVEDDGTLLNLPKLKKLMWLFSDFYGNAINSLDFTVPLASLEKIHIDLEKVRNLDKFRKPKLQRVVEPEQGEGPPVAEVEGAAAVVKAEEKPKQEEEMIDFKGYVLEDFQNSNIWNVFPFLREAEIEYVRRGEDGVNKSVVRTFLRKGTTIMELQEMVTDVVEEAE